MIEQGLLYHSCKFETFLTFLENFMNNKMTEIEGANYAGFRSDSHNCYLFFQHMNNYVGLPDLQRLTP